MIFTLRLILGALLVGGFYYSVFKGLSTTVALREAVKRKLAPEQWPSEWGFGSRWEWLDAYRRLYPAGNLAFRRNVYAAVMLACGALFLGLIFTWVR